MYSRIPPFLKTIGSTFSDAGYSVYLVGGAVRNMVSGVKPIDYDLATDAPPEEVSRLFRRVIPTGIRHGTVTVLFKGHAVEVTTFRIDGTYSNRRHPDSVSFTPSIERDLERRDFTINSLAMDLNSGNLLDPHNGREDLRKGIIRAIGNPEERFSEDGLRLLRACRFTSQLDFEVEEATKNGMIQTHHTIKNVSVERIRTEVEKILSTPRPSRAFRLMDETGLLDCIFPDLAATRGIGSKGPEGLDVLSHSLLSCDAAPDNNLPVRLSALFHDIGKTECRRTAPDGSETYYNHEIASQGLAKKILRHYRFPRLIETRVCHLIRHHMFDYTSEWSDAAVRRFIQRVGEEYLDDLLLLRLADHEGTYGPSCGHAYLRELQNRVQTLLEAGNPLTIGDLAVDGNILHTDAGIPMGPVMGKILSLLLETVLDDPVQNQRETLTGIAAGLYRSIQT